MKNIFFILLSILSPVFSHSTSIAVIGDSIATGFGVDVDASFPLLIKHDLAKQGINATVYSYSCWGASSSTMKGFSAMIFDKHYDIIIVTLGINDVIQRNYYTQTLESLKHFVELGIKKNSKVILGIITVHDFLPNVYQKDNNQFENCFNWTFNQLIQRYPIRYFTYLDMNILSKELTLDGVHPNEKGHKRIYENLRTSLKECIQEAVL